MTLSLSVTRILEGVYAHSAFQKLQNPAEGGVTLLTREHEPMLRRLAVDVFLELAVRLGGYVGDVDVDDGDILALELSDDFADTPLRLAGAYLEACVTRHLMARAWLVAGDSGRAEDLDRAAAKAERQLCRPCQEHRALPGRIWRG